MQCGAIANPPSKWRRLANDIHPNTINIITAVVADDTSPLWQAVKAGGHAGGLTEHTGPFQITFTSR